jgi:uncharacterized protein YjbI with pentapeptide repeats
MSDALAILQGNIQAKSWARGLDLRAIDLSGADLSELNAESIDFGSAVLVGVRVCKAHLNQCRFQGGNLSEVDCSLASMRMCVLDRARAERASFDGAHFEDSTAVGADFSRATFRNAHLTETSFSRALMREAVFDGAEGDGIEFRGADLSGASLKDVRFDEADFRGADLRGANLSSGRFHSADFRGALLEGARFEGADWRGAMFDTGERSALDPSLAEEAPPSVTLETLNEFLAMLPQAISGTQPAEMLKHVQELIDGLTASIGYSEEQKKAVREYFDDLLKPGHIDTRREQALLSLLRSGSDEPPEEWKAWIEPFLKQMQKDRKKP